MSPWADSSLGAGFGYATVLVQLHLGVGLILLVLAAALGAASSSKGQRGAPWEAGLKAAAAAAGPAPLLAAFALVQASGASPDLLTWVGLLASTSAVVLGVLHALLCSGFGLEVAPNPRSGALAAGLADAGGACEASRAAACLTFMARALDSLRSCGEALLVLASPPAGAQLLCASALLRAALGVHAVRGAASALALPGAGLLRGAEAAAAAAPLAATLALLDYASLGPGSWLVAPVNPVVYCALLVLVQMAAGFLAHHGGKGGANGSAEGSPAGLGHLLALGLHAAMVLGTARVAAGTLSAELSMSGISVQWGDPLFATASLLTALLVVVSAAELVCAPEAAAPAKAPTNGCSDAAGAETAEAAPQEVPGIASYAKAVVAPVHSLILGLLIVHAQSQASGDFGAPTSLASFAALPFQYGFILAAVGVGLQVAALAVGALGDAAPTLDGTGTLRWQQETGPAAALRKATLACLLGGLFLGWAGLGVGLWAVLGLTLGPCCYMLLPAEARAVCGSIACEVCSAAGEAAEGLSSCVQAYVKQRQYEQEVLHARKADEMAAQVERELGGDAKGGKALKGLKTKAAAPAEVKTSKAKTSPSKPKRR